MTIRNQIRMNPQQFDFMNIQSSSASQWRGNVTGWQHNERSASRQSQGVSNTGANAYLADIKNFGSRLNSITTDLMSNNTVFNQMRGSSSDAEAVTVSVTDQNQARRFADAGDSHSINVSQLAAVQRNTGESLTASAVSEVNSGNNFFSIETANRTFQFNINVNETDSNRTVQQKTADAINRQNTGINATVEFNSTNNTSSLVLTNRETGERHGFNIQDAQGSNAVSALGIDNTTQAAQDARFSVNGQQRTSDVNTADLGNGLSATFNRTTTENVTAGAERNNTAINNTIRDLVNNFNQLREAAMDNNSDRGALNLQNRLDGLSTAFAATLNRVGISHNSDGYLQINEERLAASVADGSAERALNRDSGFTQNLNRIAQTADNNPNSFISRQSRNTNPSPSVNESFLENIRLNPHQQQFNNHWNTVGMMFSMLG